MGIDERGFVFVLAYGQSPGNCRMQMGQRCR